MNLALGGAFLSGIGAVLSALVSLRLIRKRERKDCAERIDEIKQAMREGYRLREVASDEENPADRAH